MGSFSLEVVVSEQLRSEIQDWSGISKSSQLVMRPFSGDPLDWLGSVFTNYRHKNFRSRDANQVPEVTGVNN